MFPDRGLGSPARGLGSPDRGPGWSRAQRRLHWALAALVFAAAPVALLMVSLSYQQLLLKFIAYQLHKTIGLTVLLLVLLQIGLHWRRGRPPQPPAMPPWQRRAAAAAHGLLFLLLLAVPGLGYLVAATAPIGIPTLYLGVIPVPHLVATDAAWFALLRPVHQLLAWLLVGLAAAHAGMALLHHLQGKPTLTRMWRGG